MKSSVPISALLHHKGTALWSIAPEATVFEAIKLMADKNIGSLLVLSGDRLVGVVTERDYTRKIALQGKRSKETQVREILSGKIVSVTPHQTVEECMRLMTENRVRHLPVLENGKAIGIVSIGDLVNWTISAQDAAIAQMEQYISGSVTA
ncbi:MAG TPA: CBS domain-containing protein [Verrucomicrobiae bacterium]|nr:CBS domain-containing protein [Verrucomicrobiae bacterium]